MDVLDYSEHDGYWHRRKSTILSVFAKCGGNFLLACKDCYNLEPRVVAEFDVNGSQACCECCKGTSVIFLHENVTQNDKDMKFYEYQIIRERLSDTLANYYCRHRNSCFQGEKCRYVHTYKEMIVWQMESTRKSERASRKNLARYRGTYRGQIFHCPHCCLNFKDNIKYNDHLKTNFHIHMQRSRGSGKDVTWKYKLCQTEMPEKCPRNEADEDCDCQHAHSERELLEWNTRKQIHDARNSYVEEVPRMIHMSHLHERMQKQTVQEFKNSSQEKIILMQDKQILWQTRFQIPETYKGKIQQVSFLQPVFTLRRTVQDKFVQHLPILDRKWDKLELMIRFENPKIFGQYSGTLVFDFGNGMPIIVTNYNVTVRGEDEIGQSPQFAVLNQNWSLNRIVIAYPVEETGEVHYESNVSELERTYPIPRAESLDDVYLENLTRSTYAKQMHNFLYKEELARQAVLSRLNIESELMISEHLYTENSFIGSKNDGSLYATFTSPTRLSTDSDEGVLVRDSCSKVLIGKKEESALAYQCKIELRENSKVYLRLPPRCVMDLGIKNGQNIVLVVQYKLDRSIFCQRHYAIDALEERINLICPLVQTYAKLNDSPLNSEYLDPTQNFVLSKIHAEKRRERFNSGGKCYPPLVVAGPFGTGKTHTIRNVILEILQRNGADSRILLCTHSNSAADLYLKDIVRDPRWADWTDKILRVMYHKRNIRTVLVQEVKDFCLFVDDRSTFRYPALNELRKYRIVITTFSTSVALGVGLRTGAFTHIFLDEASQAMEPEVIMPLALANSDTTRIIIAGDHRQINERMFLSDDVKIPTLLERMYNAYKENYKQHRILLCNNYRCVDGLLQLISKLFYKEDILKSTGDAQLLPRYNAVHFVHVQGQCRMTDAGDFINESEANQVVTEIENLLTVVGQNDIMVSSPYFSQVQLIRDLLRKKRMGAVNVFSARNVQALQYKVVILSSVLRRIDCLSSGGSNFGFLSNLDLLNTVLTRAKSLVIAVGDAVTLCSTGQCAKKWESFLQHCERFNAIQPEHINLRVVRADVQLARPHLRAEAKEFVPVRHGITQFPPTVMQSPAGTCAIPETGASREEDSELHTDVQEEGEDDDPILDDMLKKSLGYDPNRLYVETDGKGNETVKYDHDLEDTDPNETHITPSEKYAGRKEIFPKHSVGKLEALLEESPNEYKRCRIHIKNWFTAEAVELENSNSIIHLQTKNHLGRTFDQDEVVVKIINEDRNGTHQKSFGQVMGILRRHRNPRQGYYICRPDEYNNGIMAPIEKSCTKFAIITPKDHKTQNPGKIPVYKINYTKASYSNLTLASCDKINWNCAYAVKYLKWAEYHPYPLGYVAEIISLQDPQKCLELEFGVSDTKKQAVVDQALKTKVPASNHADALEVFTIDPEGAKDLDDAFSLQDCKEHSDCSLLGVHVTDVSSLLPKDSPADQAAQTQGGSFYGTDHVQHMLPEELSTNKCSLLPGKTRSAISIFFHTSNEPPHISGRGPDWHIVPRKSSVRSLKQMSYSQAEDVIRGTHPGKTGLDTKIKKLWEVLWSWRVARLGQAAFFKDFNSYKELLEEGRAHLLVEEAMLAFNASIANYLIFKGFNIHLRVQQLPQIKLWKKWFYSNFQSIVNSPYLTSNSDYIGAKHKEKRLFTRTLPGYEEIIIPPGVSEITSTPHTSDNDLTREMKRYTESSSVQDCVVLYSTVWEDISKYLREGDLETALFIIALDFLHPSQVSALDQYHSIQNRSEWVARQGDDTLHSSLRLLRYTKCTSPIRRYPDIVIQRCIHRALEGLCPTVDTGRIRWDIDDRVKKFKYKFEVAELAKSLREQPSVLVACISMITDAGLRLSFPSQGDCVPSRVRELDYAHLMLDLEQKGKENKKKEIRNPAGDVILDQINAVWRFRYYDYAKYSNEAATKLAPKSETEENLTVRINQRQWRTLVKAMENPPGRNTSDQEKTCYRENVKRALEELSFKPQDASTLDDMCGETRNNPIPVKHRREIRKRLIPGSVVQIQLSSWFGKDRLPEPCVQLLKLTPDFSICVHHNHQPLHIFAHEAKIKENRVESLKKYQKTWEPLIRLDSAFNAVTDASSFVLEGVEIAWNLFSDAETSFQEVAGDAGTNLQISDHNFKIEAAFCRERYIDFHVNDLLCLRLPGVPNVSHNSFALLDNKHSTHTIVLHGAIVSVGDRKQRQKSPIRSGKITVVFKVFATHTGNTDVFWNEENLWTVEVIPLSFLHRQMQSSLHKLVGTKNKLVEQIALKRVKNEEKLFAISQMARSLFSGPSLNGFPFPLNENQKREKNKAIERKFSVIQGPPGTGKSYLGAHIAASFSLVNKTTNSKNPKKVLYCGPSNKAVDVAARFLKNAHNVKVVRMYSTSLEEKVFPNPLKPKPVIQSPTEDSKMPDEELNDIALHNLIREKRNNWADAISKFDSDVRDPTKRFTRKEIDSYKAMVTRAKIEQLKNCDIIVCTCSLSTLLYELKDDGDEIMQFSQCIIDESGMCSEPETMLPLIVANPDQVVLIGDHKQLQPVIKCKKAERLGLGESLFSKYSNMAGMLTVQYRMDPEIMEFPSQTFYDGRLLCDDSVRKRRKMTFFGRFPTENNIFWHMEGIEKQQKFRSIRGGHKSKYNMEEAKAVIKLLIYLTKNSPAKLKPTDIMVLSPYTAQCARIQDIIKKERTQLKDVHVGTIVTSQGSEADFVILSTVRSMPQSEVHAEPSTMWKQKHLGFVCDPHQINVALTRAKRGLCVIGNRNLLQVDELWEKLINAYERGAVHESTSSPESDSSSTYDYDSDSLYEQEIYNMVTEDEDEEDSGSEFSIEDFW